eukprot:TRINITY_DN10490_c0_g1_i1.p1 TRINITY_DN10490_c0_g1~~TRINITY_DN10490_c0_g1_i1.p1  ORF type:complete len:167 (+),score=18.74 TRINITY_DN10490_c0_g1_i1:74-502(+)
MGYVVEHPANPKGWRSDSYRSNWDCKSHWSFPMKGKLKRKIDKIVIDQSKELHRWATQLNNPRLPLTDSDNGAPDTCTFVEYFLKFVPFPRQSPHSEKSKKQKRKTEKRKKEKKKKKKSLKGRWAAKREVGGAVLISELGFL